MDKERSSTITKKLAFGRRQVGKRTGRSESDLICLSSLLAEGLKVGTRPNFFKIYDNPSGLRMAETCSANHLAIWSTSLVGKCSLKETENIAQLLIFF
jgi:hypothetical protein